MASSTAPSQYHDCWDDVNGAVMSLQVIAEDDADPAQSLLQNPPLSPTLGLDSLQQDGANSKKIAGRSMGSFVYDAQTCERSTVSALEAVGATVTKNNPLSAPDPPPTGGFERSASKAGYDENSKTGATLEAHGLEPGLVSGPVAAPVLAPSASRMLRAVASNPRKINPSGPPYIGYGSSMPS